MSNDTIDPVARPAGRALPRRRRRGAVVVLAVALAAGCSGADVSTGGPAASTPAPGGTSAASRPTGSGGGGTTASSGRSGGSTPGGAGSLDARIDGRTFLLAKWPGETTGTTTRSTGSTTSGGSAGKFVGRIEFAKGRLSAHVGCNGMGGSYSLDGDVLVITDGLSTTEMACDEARMARDTAFARLLDSRPTITVAGNSLTLVGSDLTLQFIDRTTADPDRPLATTTWILDGLLEGEGPDATVQSVPTTLDPPPSVVFGSRGTASVTMGCNTGSVPYTVDDERITFGNLSSTKKQCAEAVMAVDTHMASVLSGTATFTIEAGSLSLTNGDAGLQLRAEAD